MEDVVFLRSQDSMKRIRQLQAEADELRKAIFEWVGPSEAHLDGNVR